MANKAMATCLALLAAFGMQSHATTDELFSVPSGPALALTLTGPWLQIAQDSRKTPDSSVVELALPNAPTLQIKVKPRGKSRRRRSFCRFPPLWLDLPKKELAATVFAGQNKLKLVTHCTRLGSNSTAANDRLWSEYLIYQLLNQVTDYSFRVRAVNIRYVKLDGKQAGHHPGFLIEHKSAVAKRLNLKPIKQAKLSISALEPEHAALVALFQYLVGGVDYSQVRGPAGDDCCHNLTPMADSQSRVLGLAYDFDATGFVDPPYGAPLPQLKLRGYTQRLYRGFCSYKGQHKSALTTLLAARQEFEATISNLPDISDSRRKKLLRFISGFYKKLPDTASGTAWLDKRCR